MPIDKVLIITDNHSTAEKFAQENQLSNWAHVWELAQLVEEENVLVVFTGAHYNIPDWFAVRKAVEQMVQNGSAHWYHMNKK